MAGFLVISFFYIITVPPNILIALPNNLFASKSYITKLTVLV